MQVGFDWLSSFGEEVWKKMDMYMYIAPCQGQTTAEVKMFVLTAEEIRCLFDDI